MKKSYPVELPLTLQIALTKAQKWCAYQERCQQEVRDKLYEWKISGLVAENIIAELINTGFLNEERFARAFVSGKFRIKQWGRTKIRQELSLRKVSPTIIRSALNTIDSTEYNNVLRKLMLKKSKTIKEKNPFKRCYAIMRFCVTRGFEQDLVRDIYSETED
jgi:regulatory protein